MKAWEGSWGYGRCATCEAMIRLEGDAGDARRINEHGAKCTGDLHVIINNCATSFLAGCHVPGEEIMKVIALHVRRT